ncbi:MAG: sigma-54-dependent Fis family transcriptional regulator [Deltaproteobacteria bacterium]|nr:sigma-54-dependent Fis family transcriptional regulator [Deltaproteobacteria bacterium]
MKPVTTLRRGMDPGPSLKSTHPAAARWIGTLIRMTSAHPGMTRILDVVERLSDRPYRTNFVLLGEPGTGKEGLGRALANLTSPAGPLVRYDVAGFPEDEALALLCGAGRRGGVAEAADGGSILIEEAAGLPARVQAALLRLLKTGRCERLGAAAVNSPDDDERPGDKSKRWDVRVVAMSDRDLLAEIATGRFRHDLYHRLARVVLTLPPLRERKDDIGPAVIWMGNRILRQARVPLDLMGAEDFNVASREEKRRAIAVDPEAIVTLEQHTWPGNFRELEAVLERALLLYREGDRLRAEAISAALQNGEIGS